MLFMSLKKSCDPGIAVIENNDRVVQESNIIVSLKRQAERGRD